MEVTVLKESDKNTYASALAELPEASFLQSWEWGEWQKYMGKRVVRTITTEANKVMAASQWVELPPKNIPVWYAPRGPVVSNDLFNLPDFLKAHKKCFKKALALRLEPEELIPNLSNSGIKIAPSQPEKTIIVNLASSAEKLLSDMHEKTRYNIRVAKRHEVNIHSISAKNLTSQDIETCLNLLNATAKRQGFRDHSRSYIKSLLEFFGKLESADFTVKVYFAKHESDILCTAVMIDYSATRMYMYGGSSEIKRNVMAPYLLHWQAIGDAKELGLKYYDLGGIETVNKKTAGFTKFKQGFGGNEITYPGTWDIPFKPVIYRAYGLARTLNRWRLRMF